MTDVDTALTNEESTGGSPRISASSPDSPHSSSANPFAPPPEIDKSLTFRAEQRSTRCFTVDTTLQPVLFQIDARGIGSHLRSPRRYSLNLALVVDRSGSMEGQWLDYVKRALGALLDKVGPTDFVSVIAFAETAELVLPARHVVNKAELKDKVSRIAAGSTTNLHQGLMTAFQQLSAVKHPGTLNRVILITDGGPTVGMKDLNSITAQVLEQKARGISLSSVGLSVDYDEELLTTIAHRTGGNYYHVPDPDRLSDVLGREVDRLSRVVAHDLQLRVRLASGVGVRQVYGHPPMYGNRVVETQLADVEAESGIRSLWDFEISTRPPGRYRVAQADLRYRDLNTGRPERLTADLVYEFTAAPSVDEPGHVDFVKELETAEAIRDIDKTLLAVRRQNLDAAAVLQEIDKVKTTFVKHGRTLEIEAASIAAADIQAGGSLTKTLVSTVYHLDQGKTH